MSDPLAPCPFAPACSPSELSLRIDSDWTAGQHKQTFVFCEGCGTRGPACASVKEATERWNRRAAPEPPLEPKISEEDERIVEDLVRRRAAPETPAQLPDPWPAEYAGRMIEQVLDTAPEPPTIDGPRANEIRRTFYRVAELPEHRRRQLLEWLLRRVAPEPPADEHAESCASLQSPDPPLSPPACDCEPPAAKPKALPDAVGTWWYWDPHGLVWRGTHFDADRLGTAIPGHWIGPLTPPPAPGEEGSG